MKKCITAMLIFISCLAFGQSRTVSGKVITDQMEIFPGIIIQTKDSLYKTYTNTNGEFSIEVPTETEFIEATYVGFIPNIVSVKDKCEVNIILLDDIMIEFSSVQEEQRYLNKKLKRKERITCKQAYKKGIFQKEKPCS